MEVRCRRKNGTYDATETHHPFTTQRETEETDGEDAFEK
jgi:hypothetical protein